MISADHLLDRLHQLGFDFFAGVPCSFLNALITRALLRPEITYLSATCESEAIGIAAGAWLAGRKAGVMCQNSGLCDALNPLTSLNRPFAIPVLLMVSARGRPGIGDEPQHEVLGMATEDLLDTVGIPHSVLAQDEVHALNSLEPVCTELLTGSRSHAIILEKGTFAACPTADYGPRVQQASRRYDWRQGGEAPARLAVLRQIVQSMPADAACIATTGMTGRELFSVGDREQYIYLAGSMGCASAVGLGVALNVDKEVIVLDGDGAALMRLGNLATIGWQAPPHFTHIILVNGTYDSTGGQPAASNGLDFTAIAAACGYPQVHFCDSGPGVAEAITRGLQSVGPRLIHAVIQPGSEPGVGRPSLPPAVVAHRFRQFLKSSRPTG
jgi:phosphonopyruvate decarboxylase